MRPSSTALLLVLAVLGLALPAGAAPKYVRISLMEDASTSVGLAWTTLSGTAGVTVQYGTSKTAYALTATGTSKKVSATLGTVSEATLTKLKPNTVYYYRVGGAGGWSPQYYFRTGIPQNKSCGAMRFAVLGDSRAESFQGDKGVSDNWMKLVNAAIKHKPAFFWHSGDIVHDGKKEKQWDNQLKVTASASPYYPVMYSIGNHDDGTSISGAKEDNYHALLNYPKADKTLGGNGAEDAYFFTYGNAIFIVLSTESWSTGSPKFKAQADWMDKVLTAHPKRWKFVNLHKPIYTKHAKIPLIGTEVNHKPNESGQNAAFVPVFNKHHVDMVFQGHNHWYERFAPSNCSSGGSSKPCKASSFAKGTVYVTAGGGGATVIPCLFDWCKTDSTRLKAMAEHHYVLLEIKDHTMTYKMVNILGQTRDSFTIKKTAPSPDPCALPPDAGVPDTGAPDAGAPDGTVGTDAPVGTDGPVKADGTVSTDGPAKTDEKLSADGLTKADGPLTGDSSTPDIKGDEGCSCEVGQSGGGWGILLLVGLVLWRRGRERIKNKK